MDEWIDIKKEPAPRGVPVHVHGYRIQGQAAPGGPYKWWMTTVGEFDTAGQCRDLLDPGCDCVTDKYVEHPTHWMPMPMPPEN